MPGRQAITFQERKQGMGNITEEENKLFAELRTYNPDIIDDGVADEEGSCMC